MRALRYLAYGAGGLAILAVIAAAAAAMLFDPNQWKGEIERVVKEQKNRTLKLEGDIKLAFWPNLGASIGKASLSEHAANVEFASLESAHISLGLLPLLRGEMVVDGVRLAGVRATITKGKDGKANYDDLLAAAPSKPGEAKQAEANAGEAKKVRFDISGVRIERSSVSFRDAASGRELAVSDLNLRTGRIADDVPGKLELSAMVKGKNPALEARVNLAASYRFNLERKSFSLSGLDAKLTGAGFGVSAIDLVAKGDLASDPGKGELSASDLSVSAKGSVDKDAFEVKFAAPKLALAADKASGAGVTAELALKGAQRSANARFKLAGVEGSAKALSVATLSLEFDAAAGDSHVKGTLSAPLKANLEAKLFELPKLVANLTLASPQMPQRNVTLPISGAVRADLGKESVAADLATRFDESTVQARLAVTRFAQPSYSFDLNVDRLNVDRYFPPKTGGARTDGTKDGGARPEGTKTDARGDTPVDLSALKGLSANGRMQIGAFQAQRVKLSNLKVEVHAANGVLQASPHTASLYEGTLSGALSLNANGNQVSLKESLHNVSIGPLIRDLAQRDMIEGRGNVALDVHASGASVNALKKTLAGSAQVSFRDGAIKGINLAETLRKTKSAFGSKSAQQQGADKSQKTDFSELSASFAIRGGVAHNEDLSAKAPLFRLAGAGDIDIGSSSLNYVAKASVVASSKGQGGADLGHIAGVTVPVKLTGPFDAPKYEIDYAAVATDLAKSRLTDKLLERLGGGKSAAPQPAAGGQPPASGTSPMDKLRGLFGR